MHENDPVTTFAGYDIEVLRERQVAEIAAEIFTNNASAELAGDIAIDYAQGNPIRPEAIEAFLSSLNINFSVQFCRPRPNGETPLFSLVERRWLKPILQVVSFTRPPINDNSLNIDFSPSNYRYLEYRQKVTANLPSTHPRSFSLN